MFTSTRKHTTTVDGMLAELTDAAAKVGKKSTVKIDGHVAHIHLKTMMTRAKITATVTPETVTFESPVGVHESWKLQQHMADVLDDQGAGAVLERSTGKADPRTVCALLAAADTRDQVIAYAESLGLSPWRLVATEREIIVQQQKVFSGGRQVIPLEKVSSVTVDSGAATSTVTVHTSGTGIKVDNLPQPSAQDFAATVTAALSAPVPAQTAPAATSADVLAELAKLAELHAAGVLTADEFAAMKSRIIGA